MADDERKLSDSTLIEDSLGGHSSRMHRQFDEKRYRRRDRDRSIDDRAYQRRRERELDGLGLGRRRMDFRRSRSRSRSPIRRRTHSRSRSRSNPRDQTSIDDRSGHSHSVFKRRDPIERGMSGDEFYLRYYVGHRGRFGHEFMEFEFTDDGLMRYANNSKYKGHDLLKKQVFVNDIVLDELKRIIDESEILKENDEDWPEANEDGRQEIEIVHRNQHISFVTAKIGSLLDIQHSRDPDGLKSFYYLMHDLKALVLSLLSLHFKVKPTST